MRFSAFLKIVFDVLHYAQYKQCEMNNDTAKNVPAKRLMRSFEADPDVHRGLQRIAERHTKITPIINAALREYFAAEFGWGDKKRGDR